MPRKPKPEAEPQENVLTSTAKAIGNVAGKIAHIAGVEHTGEPKKSTKPAKLQKKNKSRLPRREKKAKKKAAAATSSKPTRS